MEFRIRRLEPERHRERASAAPAGYCCCCCCCIHSIAGVVGAAIESGKLPKVVRRNAETGAIETNLEMDFSAARTYWCSLWILGMAIFATLIVTDLRQSALRAILILALFLPAVQLVASLVAWVVLSLSPLPGKSIRLRHLWRITRKSALWALAGLIVTGFILFLASEG